MENLKDAPIFLIVIPWLFSFVGLYYLWKADTISKAIQCLKARHWPQAEATVIDSAVRETIFQGGHASNIGYQTVVEYTYTVGNRSYKSTVINPLYDSVIELEPIKAEHLSIALGKTPLFCRYNPKKPKQALLITTIRSRWMIGPLLACLSFVAVGPFFTLLSYVSRTEWASELHNMIQIIP